MKKKDYRVNCNQQKTTILVLVDIGRLRGRSEENYNCG